MSDNEVMAPITDDDLRRGGLPDNMKMAPGLAIYFVDALYHRCKAVALRMSEARGMVGPHLINNPGACMAIISRSITWNLDPFAVAQATYEVKGKIGYEGKLCQAILENSGAIDGQLKFVFFGDWDKLRGKFKMTGTVGSGERKPQQLWTDEDEIGLGVKVTAQVKGESTPREEEFFLAEMQPRNSTLWILRPKQQMRYATARAYGNLATPGIIMGIPFDVDPSGMGEGALDITPPKPQISEFTQAPEREFPALGDWTAKANFANTLAEISQIRKDGLAALPPETHDRFNETCDTRGRQIAAGLGPVLVDQEADAPEDQGGPKPEDKVVTPEKSEALMRGLDVLSRVEKAVDVEDLFATISEDLSTEELREWRAACNDKKAALKKAEKPKRK